MPTMRNQVVVFLILLGSKSNVNASWKYFNKQYTDKNQQTQDQQKAWSEYQYQQYGYEQAAAYEESQQQKWNVDYGQWGGTRGYYDSHYNLYDYTGSEQPAYDDDDDDDVYVVSYNQDDGQDNYWNNGYDSYNKENQQAYELPKGSFYFDGQADCRGSNYELNLLEIDIDCGDCAFNSLVNVTGLINVTSALPRYVQLLPKICTGDGSECTDSLLENSYVNLCESVDNCQGVGNTSFHFSFRMPIDDGSYVAPENYGLRRKLYGNNQYQSHSFMVKVFMRPVKNFNLWKALTGNQDDDFWEHSEDYPEYWVEGYEEPEEEYDDVIQWCPCEDDQDPDEEFTDQEEEEAYQSWLQNQQYYYSYQNPDFDTAQLSREYYYWQKNWDEQQQQEDTEENYMYRYFNEKYYEQHGEYADRKQYKNYYYQKSNDDDFQQQGQWCQCQNMDDGETYSWSHRYDYGDPDYQGTYPYNFQYQNYQRYYYGQLKNPGNGNNRYQYYPSSYYQEKKQQREQYNKDNYNWRQEYRKSPTGHIYCYMHFGLLERGDLNLTAYSVSNYESWWQQGKKYYNYNNFRRYFRYAFASVGCGGLIGLFLYKSGKKRRILCACDAPAISKEDLEANDDDVCDRGEPAAPADLVQPDKSPQDWAAIMPKRFLAVAPTVVISGEAANATEKKKNLLEGSTPEKRLKPLEMDSKNNSTPPKSISDYVLFR